MRRTMAAVVTGFLALPGVAEAYPCQERHRAPMIDLQIQGKRAVRTAALVPTAAGNHASRPISVTVERQGRPTIRRLVRDADGWVKFRLRRGEQASVTAAYTEDWSRLQQVKTGEEDEKVPLAPAVIAQLQILGVDVTPYLTGELTRLTPTYRYEQVEDRCERTLTKTVRRR
jgi:hypothetical protein